MEPELLTFNSYKSISTLEINPSNQHNSLYPNIEIKTSQTSREIFRDIYLVLLKTISFPITRGNV
jgi:hypothetical protein